MVDVESLPSSWYGTSVTILEPRIERSSFSRFAFGKTETIVLRGGEGSVVAWILYGVAVERGSLRRFETRVEVLGRRESLDSVAGVVDWFSWPKELGIRV